MKHLLTFLLLFQCYSVLACKLSNTNSWYWDDSKLVRESKNVYIAKVIDVSENKKIVRSPFNTDYKLKVLQTVKGKKVESFNVLGGSPSKTNSSVYYHKNCKLLVKLKKDKTYLVFKDSFNSKSYVEIKIDDWTQFVFENINLTSSNQNNPDS